MDREQKKREKHRKKREQAKKAARAKQEPTSSGALLRQASSCPMGPAFVSVSWHSEGPDLVSVIASRRLPSGKLLPAMALVDRTCLGVKSAFVMRPMDAEELRSSAERMGELHGGVEPCEPLVVQSVVFHAIDFARTLGFEPDADFPEEIFGPRPEALLDTPLARPSKPVYISGPDDDVEAITAKLEAAGY